jgi:hypothetical protein
MSDCPACGRPVDPLRARAVGVRDGKVVGYCSAECARSMESKPTAIPTGSTPSLDSGPVIEIVRDVTGKTPRRDPTPTPVKPPPPPRKDATPVPKTRAATPAAGTPVQKFPIPEPPPRSNRGLALLIGLVVVGAGAVAVVKFVL